MTTACVIVAALIIIAALFITCSDLLEQRNRARADAIELAEDFDAVVRRLAEVLDEHAECSVPVEPQRSDADDDLPVADVDVPVHTDMPDDAWLELLVTPPVDGATS